LGEFTLIEFQNSKGVRNQWGRSHILPFLTALSFSFPSILILISIPFCSCLSNYAAVWYALGSYVVFMTIRTSNDYFCTADVCYKLSEVDICDCSYGCIMSAGEKTGKL